MRLQHSVDDYAKWLAMVKSPLKKRASDIRKLFLQVVNLAAKKSKTLSDS